MTAKLDDEVAELRRANAELQQRLDEALARESATAEVLGVINSSPGDLAPVFEAMLEKALSLCEAAQGTLRIYDGEKFNLVAVKGEEALVEAVQRLGPIIPASHNSWTPLVKGDVLVHIADSRETPGYREIAATRERIDRGGIRTWLAVPLRKGDVLLGAFAVYRREVRPFSDKQIALLQNFAAQAVIAMENARLLTETREALEQQTATAEVLGVINASPGDLAPVFDAIVDKAMRLCGAAFGGLHTYDGERFTIAASLGHPQYGELVRGLGPVRPNPRRGTTIDRIAGGERVIQIADIADDLGPEAEFSVRRATIDFGFHTLLSIALRRDEKLFGALHLYRQEARPFTDKQIALLQNFAAQAVIAMENARLITETREALDQQTATAEVLGVINASPGELTPVFNAMLERALNLCDVPFGGLWTYDGTRAHPAVLYGVPPEMADFYQAPIKDSPGGWIYSLAQGAPLVHVPDITADQVYLTRPGRRALVELGGFRSTLMVPLRKDGRMLGLICLYGKEARPFSDKQIALLQNFAAQAVIAMENARLLTETREALDQQTATAEVLGVINASPGDLAPVFDAILEKAMALCSAATGVMTVRDGEQFRTIAARGVPAAFVEFRKQNPVPPGMGGIAGRIRSGEPFVHIIDLKDDDLYREGHPQRRAMVDVAGARTWLAVGLKKDENVLGAIDIFRGEVRPFSDKEITLVQNFAAQAVIAMESARLVDELRQRTDEVAALNRGLEARVAEQVEELGRVGRLKRFLAPQLAELIVSQGDEKILESHRREIVVVFCDLRGYTAFTETAEPEEVLDFLREYHGAMGPLVAEFEGTLDQFSGDGIMVFFNDPVPIPDPAERAVKMAMAMREAASTLIADWRERGRDLGFGAGIAQGYATLGQIGFAERAGYTAIGTVCNVAARLCGEAKDGQILLSQRVNVALKGAVATEQVGALALKGLTQPVVTYNVPLR
jgi:adenylate cyclase